MRLGAVIPFACIALFGSQVCADSVGMRFVGFGAGAMVQYEQSGQIVNTFAGQRLFEFSGGTGSLAGLSGTMVTFGSAVMGNAVSLLPVEHVAMPVDEIYGQGGTTEIGQIRSSAIGELYLYAAGRELQAHTDFTTAFQIALWEVIADYDADIGNVSLSVEAGSARFRRTDGSGLGEGVVSELTGLFGAIGNNSGSRPLGLANPDGGGEFMMVPLPTSGAMGGVALILLASRRRRGVSI